MVIETAKTDATGQYLFNVAPGTYFVAPAPGRTECASPNEAKVTDGINTDFTMRNVPATIQVSGTSGDFVLLTHVPWNQSKPPTIESGAPYSNSSSIGLNSKTTLKLPGNKVTYLTCWAWKGAQYVKTSSNAINGGAVFLAQSQLQVACP